MTARSWTLVFIGFPPRDDDRPPVGVTPELARRIAQGKKAARDRWVKKGHLAARMHDIPRLNRIRASAVFYRHALGACSPKKDQESLIHIGKGLVAAGVIPKDTRRHLVWGDVLEERGKPYRVEIRIEELEAV